MEMVSEEVEEKEETTSNEANLIIFLINFYYPFPRKFRTTKMSVR